LRGIRDGLQTPDDSGGPPQKAGAGEEVPDETGEKMTQDKFDLNLRCHRCKRFAYTDRFDGEYDEKGYCCTHCVKIANDELFEKLKTTIHIPV